MLPASLGVLPRLAARIDELQQQAMLHGILTAIPKDGGARSTGKQWEKFKQGRHQLPSGLWVPNDPKTRAGIVTNARPDKAPHCKHVDYDGSVGAAACDVAIVVAERVAWLPKDPGYSLYPVLGQLGKALGLVWGGDWHGTLADLDHFELSDFRELELAPEDV